jgi:transposase
MVLKDAYSFQEVATETGQHYNTVYGHIKKGKLDGGRQEDDAKYRISHDQLMRYKK